MTGRTATNSTGRSMTPNISRVLTPSLLLALTLSCVTADSAQKSERVILIDGEQQLVEDVAKREYDLAMQDRAGGNETAARARLEAIRKAYADASWADHATVAVAQFRLDDGDSRGAQQMLETLLLEDPTSPAADQARYVLALSQLAQGDAAAAAPTLKNIVDRLPTDGEKQVASLELADQLYKSGQGGEAARYLSRGMELTDDPAEKLVLEERLIALVDSHVRFVDVRRLKEVEAKSGTLLDELLTYKLARIHVHLRDWVSADDMAKQYLQRYPKGRFAKPAGELVASLMRRVEVDARAVGVILPLSGPYKRYGQRALTAIKLGFGVPVERADYFKKIEREEKEPTAEEPTGQPDPDARPDKEEEDASADDLSVTITPKGAKVAIRLVVRDSRGDPGHAQVMMRQLVEEEHVIAVIGDILLDTSLPVALKAEELSVPIVSLSRRDGLPQLGSWVFRLSFTAKKQAAALAALAMDAQGHKRFAVLYPRHSYGHELMNAFWDEVEKRNGEITAIESYGHDQTTFTREAKNLVGRLHLSARYEYAQCTTEARAIEAPYRRKKAVERCKDGVSPLIDFDALLIPDDYRTVSYIVPALAAEDMLLTNDRRAMEAYKKTTSVKRVRPIQLLGGNMWHDDELARRLQRQIDGAIIVDGYAPGDGTAMVKGFRKDFAGVHRSAPALLEAQAFDAAHLARAIIDGQGGGAPKSRSNMRDRLAAAKDFPGVTGLLRFDADGDSATPPHYFTFKRDRLEPAKLSDYVKEEEKAKPE